jgi:hypothetical protein
MEVIDVISHHVDKTQNIIVVEFKTTEDDDDMVREDFIEYSFYEDFGFDKKNNMEILESMFLDEVDEWDDDDYDYVDEENLISFLNEYYIVYPKKLPKAQYK